MRWPATALVVAVFALATAACQSAESEPTTATSQTADGGGATTATTTDQARPADSVENPSDAPPTPPPSFPEFEIKTPVTWNVCRDGFIECGVLDVPLDHARPDGATIELTMVRVPAGGDPGEVRGTIFVNPGGPGVSGTDYVLGGFRFEPEIMDRYHLIGFDPRGVGASTGLSCSWDRADGPLADHSPDDPAEIAALDAEAAAVADECGSDGELLGHLHTDAVARDLDLLRRAVGDEQLHYYGFSYGTLIGLVYAELFPDRVGHLGLDGVVDPRGGLEGLLRQQAAAFEERYKAMDAACGSEITCPEGGLGAAHDRLAQRLETDGPIGGLGPTELDLASLVVLYNESTWNLYAQALRRADETGDVSELERLNDAFAGAVDYTAYAAVICTDGSRPDGPQEWEAFAAELTAQHPRFGALVANEVRVCAHWPNDPVRERPLVDATTAPVLVVGATGDPATPVDNAIAVADGLAASGLIIHEADLHTSYRASDCVRRAVTAYFLDDVVPTSTLRC